MKKVIQTKACKGKLHNGELVPLNEFVKHRNYKDGYSNICKKCNNLKYNVTPKERILKELDIINEKLDYLIGDK